MKSKRSPKQSNNDKQSFWSTFPGVLTALAAVISAIAALLIALNAIGFFEPQATPTSVSTVLTPSLTSTAELTFTPTLAPTASITPTQTSSTNIILEDFEDEEAQGFIFEGDGTWKIIDDSGNKVLEVVNDESSELHIDFPPAMFSGEFIEFQIRFIEFPESVTGSNEDWGSVDFHFREQSDGQEGYVLTIRPSAPLKHIEASYVPKDENLDWEPIPDGEYPINFDEIEWHSIRLDLQGDQISAFLDGQLMYKFTDTRFTSGALLFLVRKSTTVQFDNVKAVLVP